MKKIRQLENERRTKEYMDDIEVKKLLDNLDKSYFPECRDFAVIFLILDTGMRLGECLSLTTDMVNITE